MGATREHRGREREPLGAEHIGGAQGVAKARELDRVVGDLHPHKDAALRKTELFERAELVERQVPGGVGGVRHRIGELDAPRHGEEEARAEGMRDAQQVAEIHRLRNAVHPDCEIAAQTPAPGETGPDASASASG